MDKKEFMKEVRIVMKILGRNYILYDGNETLKLGIITRMIDDRIEDSQNIKDTSQGEEK